MSSKPKSEHVVFEDEFDLEVFQTMDERSAKEYFFGLFLGLLENDRLHVIWSSVPSNISTTMQMDWLVSSAMEHLDSLNAASIFEADSLLASQLKKADHRRDAKKRQKEKKKAQEEKDNLTKSVAGKGLTQSQLDCYLSVHDVLKGFEYYFSSDNVLSAIRKANFDANSAVEELLSFGVVEPPSSRANSGLEPTPSRSQSAVKKNTPRAVPNTHSFSLQADAATGKHTVIRGNSATLTTCSSSESDTSPRSTASPLNSTPVTPTAVSPLLQYFLMHLRTRNPGILVSLDDGCMVFKGMQADCCVVNAAGELAVSLDLHGQTRKQALDLMQSSLLYYHNLFSSGHMDNYVLQEELRHISQTQKANKAVSKLQFAEVKCVAITYVVGQGLHSEKAVPVLRNTLMRDLKSFWSDFNAVIDPVNQGQIVVKVRRL